jgi:hypothetical protein
MKLHRHWKVLVLKVMMVKRSRYSVTCVDLGELIIEPNVILTATVKDRCLFIRRTGLSKLC